LFATELRLRVHPSQFITWKEYFALHPTDRGNPEVIGDANLDPANCILQTRLGVIDLSIETQLKEIEHGFSDLLAQRPEIKS
jgi:flagellar assembly protein FliH